MLKSIQRAEVSLFDFVYTKYPNILLQFVVIKHAITSIQKVSIIVEICR